MSETRQAKLPDGEIVTWHMFFVDSDGDPMALVEMRGGNVRKVYATWVEFFPTKRSPDARDSTVISIIPHADSVSYSEGES